MKTTIILASLLLATIAAVSVIAKQNPPQGARTTRAVVVIVPTVGNKVAGVLYITALDTGVRVQGEITGLPASSKHGFHIHEFGDMTGKDGMSMGSHFNPAGVDHGLMDQTVRHAGDMGNIESDANGVAKVDLTFSGANLGGRNGIIGRGIVVHEKADDGGQPVGNAGARIGFGVIGVAKPE